MDRGLVTWNLDGAQMGVGGDTSWGRLVHDRYTIPAGPKRYAFTLLPFDRAEIEPEALARRYRQRLFSVEDKRQEQYSPAKSLE